MPILFHRSIHIGFHLTIYFSISPIIYIYHCRQNKKSIETKKSIYDPANYLSIYQINYLSNWPINYIYLFRHLSEIYLSRLRTGLAATLVTPWLTQRTRNTRLPSNNKCSEEWQALSQITIIIDGWTDNVICRVRLEP